jgi:glyoxylase-like metal-dependent hydrolase (beta-lactamase superfamily II)
LLARVRELELRVAGVVLTHGHLDHAGGVGEMLAALGPVPVYVHPADLAMCLDPVAAGGALGRVATVVAPARESLRPLLDHARLELAGAQVEALHVAGHTPGGTCLFVDAPRPLCFTGDNLFARGAGRTDLDRGSADDLGPSLRRALAGRPGDTVVLPGHGPETTLRAARATNPLLRAGA